MNEEVIKNWIKKAEEDLKVVLHELNLDEESIMKLKGKAAGQLVKNKIHLKLWFYDYVLDNIKEVRDKIMVSNILKADRINEKKVMVNDLIINAGLDCMEEMGKKG